MKDLRVEMEFLQNHKNADEIVVDSETGRVVKAVYSRIDGQPRKHIAEYYLESYE